MEPTIALPAWTPERRAAFLENLAACGNVQEAAGSVGLTRQSAYKVRARDAEFANAWELARLAALEVAVDALHCRAVEGYVEEVWHNGKCVGVRQVFDNKLLLAHIARLDARRTLRYDDSNRLPQFIDAVARTDDTAAARRLAHRRDDYPLTDDHDALSDAAYAREMAHLREIDPEFGEEVDHFDALSQALRGEETVEILSEPSEPAAPPGAPNRRARRAARAARRR